MIYSMESLDNLLRHGSAPRGTQARPFLEESSGSHPFVGLHWLLYLELHVVP